MVEKRSHPRVPLGVPVTCRRADGTTFATYFLYTDPSGAIPKWVVNKLAGSGMRDLFSNVRRTLSGSTKR